MKFNTKGIRRKDFRTEEAYIEEVWKRNELGTIMKKERFINVVKAYKDINQTNITGALAKTANSIAFTSQRERGLENFIYGLKENGVFKPLTTSVRDERGHFTAFDREKLKWDRERGGYVYADQIFINIKDSPESITLERL